MPGGAEHWDYLDHCAGVVGACLGGLIVRTGLTWTNDRIANRMWPGWLMSIVGGVIVLGVWLAITGQRNVSARAR